MSFQNYSSFHVIVVVNYSFIGASSIFSLLDNSLKSFTMAKLIRAASKGDEVYECVLVNHVATTYMRWRHCCRHPAVIIEVNEKQKKWRVKFDKRPQDKHDKW